MPANLPHQQIAFKANFAAPAMARRISARDTANMLDLRRYRQAKGWTIEELAGRVGLDAGTISRIETGKRWVTEETLSKLAAELGISPRDLIAAQHHPVAVVGKVGAGTRVELVDAYAVGAGMYHVEAPPDVDPSDVVAVEVAGDSMMPLIQPGAVLFFARRFEVVDPSDVNRVVILETDDGLALVKQIRPGREPGTFDLYSANAGTDPIYGQRVKWAARLRRIVPPEDVRRIEEPSAA